MSWDRDYAMAVLEQNRKEIYRFLEGSDRMKLSLMKFIVGTAFVGAVIEESKAMNILRRWKNGEYSPGQIIGEDSPPQGGWPWAVKTDSILSITVEPVQIPSPQQPQQMYLPPNRSGIL